MNEAAIAALLADWQAMLGPVPPGAREWAGGLSSGLRARLLKIHSLPGSKRYAECPSEMALILERQNTLIDVLIGEGTPYTLLFTRFGDGRDLHAADDARFVDARLTLLFSLDGAVCTPEPFFAWRPDGFSVRLYARQQRWVRGAEDDLLAATAEDEIAGLLLFCPARGVLVAPYDGGVSMIASSREQRSALRARFADWLPGGSAADPALVIGDARPEERDAVRALKALDATIYLGDDNAVVVVKVLKSVVDDVLLAQIGTLSGLRTLMLLSQGPGRERNTRATDVGLRALHGLTGLERLDLEDFVGVTEVGVAALQAALPGCAVTSSV